MNRRLSKFICGLCILFFTGFVLFLICLSINGGFVEHGGPVNSVAINAEGIIASASKGQIFFWKNGFCEKKFAAHDQNISSINFSKDGALLATCSSRSQEVKVWDWKSKKQLLLLAKMRPYQVAFDRSGKYLLTAGYNNVITCWDWSRQKQVWESDSLSRHLFRNNFSISNANILTFVTNSCQVWLVDLNKDFALTKRVTSCGEVCISPDNSALAFKARSSPIVCLNVKSSGPMIELDNSDHYAFEPFGFSSNSVYLANGISLNRVEVWNWKQKKLIMTLGRPAFSGFQQFAFSSDGHLLTAGGDRSVKVWDISTGKLLLNIGDGSYANQLFKYFYMMAIGFMIYSLLALICFFDDKYAALLAEYILAVCTLGATLILIPFKNFLTRNGQIISCLLLLICLFFVITIYPTSLLYFVIPVGLWVNCQQLVQRKRTIFAACCTFLFLGCSIYLYYWKYLRN